MPKRRRFTRKGKTARARAFRGGKGHKRGRLSYRPTTHLPVTKHHVMRLRKFTRARAVRRRVSSPVARTVRRTYTGQVYHHVPGHGYRTVPHSYADRPGAFTSAVRDWVVAPIGNAAHIAGAWAYRNPLEAWGVVNNAIHGYRFGR